MPKKQKLDADGVPISLTDQIEQKTLSEHTSAGKKKAARETGSRRWGGWGDLSLGRNTPAPGRPKPWTESPGPTTRDLLPQDAYERRHEPPTSREPNDLRNRKYNALLLAHSLGHDMEPWHHRPNDEEGQRFNSYCRRCNRLGVVCTNPVPNRELLYGKAFTERCG